MLRNNDVNSSENSFHVFCAAKQHFIRTFKIGQYNYSKNTVVKLTTEVKVRQ